MKFLQHWHLEEFLLLIIKITISVAKLFKLQQPQILTSIQGYTKSNVLKANTGKLSKSAKAALVKGSMAGMKNNVFSDDDSSDNRTVDVTNLSKADQAEISKYALVVINSARAKFGKKAWTYSSHALRFANVVANTTLMVVQFGTQLTMLPESNVQLRPVV